MSETTAFADVANIVGGYAFKGADLGVTGFPVIKIAEISPPRIDVESAERIPFEKVQGLDRFKLRDGDILMAMTGATTGKVGRLRYTEPAYLNQRVARITAKAGRDFDDYVWAIVSQPRFEELVLANAHGSAQPNVSSDGIGRIQITKLPENSQIEIGRIARSLDDKIEQNRRTGAKLEGLARAVFKAWFVDFEPVKAKAAGATAFPGMPPETFAALPTRFEDSELGPVPQGWEVGKLGDLLSERGERVTPSPETVALPYVPIDCITTKRITLEAFKGGEEAQSSLIRFKKGDVLFGAMRPYFHKVCLAPFEGTTRTTCFVLVPRTNDDRGFALMLASEASTVEFATTHSVGSTIPYAKWQNSLCDMPCVMPPEQIRRTFNAFVDPVLSLNEQAVQESAKLAALRDYLLPRLLSGRVRVRGEIT